jgi:hypothetical protein
MEKLRECRLAICMSPQGEVALFITSAFIVTGASRAHVLVK